MRPTARNGSRPEIRRRTNVADDAALRERFQEHRILGRPNAVRDPDRPEETQGVGHRFRPAPLARMHDREETRLSPAPIHLREIARVESRFVPAEAESHDAPPRPLGVEIEDA
jgi:hypothetical protein